MTADGAAEGMERSGDSKARDGSRMSEGVTVVSSLLFSEISERPAPRNVNVETAISLFWIEFA